MVALASGLVLAASRPASATVRGRYVGSFAHTQNGEERDDFRQSLDVRSLSATPQGNDLMLGMSLLHQMRFDAGDESLVRGRLFGHLQGRAWRVNGEFVPWQDITVGPNPVREQSYLLGFRIDPRNRPGFRTQFRRRDREALAGKASLADFRAELYQDLRNFGYHVAVRDIENRPSGEEAPLSITRELRGGVRGNVDRRRYNARAAYDAVFTDLRRGERRLDTRTQTLDGDGLLRIGRPFSVGGNGYVRWGYSDDSGASGRQDIDEQIAGLFALYRASFGLDLRASREYRRRNVRGSTTKADYARLEAILRRYLYRNVSFQTGYLRTFEIESTLQEIPRSSAYAFVDGRIHRGVEGRLEVRASDTANSDSSELQWRRLAELRTRPLRSTRFDLLWRKDRLPEIAGARQVDREWRLTASYEPMRVLSLLGSFRDLDGEGRILRNERQYTLNSTWRTSQRSSLGLNWTRRESDIQGNSSKVTTYGADITTWLSGDWELHAAFYRTIGQGVRDRTTYSATLTKNF